MQRAAVIALALGLACGPSVDDPQGSASVGTSGNGSGTSDATLASSGSATATSMTGSDVSTTESGADDTSSPATEDNGVTFSLRPDSGPDLPLFCSPLDQDCPAGFKCMPWSADGSEQWNVSGCFPVVRDPAQVGEPCAVQDSAYSGYDDCDVGLICWDVGRDGMGTCQDMCTFDGEEDTLVCANPTDQCVAAYDSNVVLCVPACNPLVPSCGPGEACYSAEQGWGCFLDDPALGGTHGDPCPVSTSANACNPGFACAAAASFTVCEGGLSGCCSPICDLDDPDADAFCSSLDPAQTCEPWFEPPAPDGYENVGVCAIAR